MTDQNKQLSYVYPILDTKLFVPKIKSELVRRKRLIARLNEGIDKRFILISAPAGFGKTTLLSEWVSQGDTPVAWISIDPTDNDPIYLIQYIIVALQTIEPEFANDLLELLTSPHQMTSDSIMLFLIKEIEKFPRRFILAMDDYHLINTQKINRIVELLLERMPQQMCLAIATRADPGFPFSRLRVTNQMTEIRISDLYFTKDETSLFFSQVMQLDLTEKEIERLLSRTEGWIAGLQLAALSLKDRDDAQNFIDDFAGNDRLVADYLAEEVLRRQPQEIQQFLIRTSILHRFSESLCAYITDQKDCQAILENLEQNNLFLVPLDTKRQWYRYHHLFADLLQQKLLLNDQDLVDQLHMKASDWYQANGCREEAINHAIEAKNFKQAAELMEKMLENSWQGGEQVMIINWLKMLPDSIIFSYPNLCICHGSILFERGQHDLAEACLSKLDASLSEGPASSEKEPVLEIKGRIAAQRTYWATLKGDPDGIDQYSQQALDQLNETDDIWKMLVYLGAAISNEVRGNMGAAMKMHRWAIESAKSSGSAYYYMYTRVWIAIKLKIMGKLPEAIEICRQLLQEVNESNLAFNSAMGSVFGTWGEMIYEGNDLEESYAYAKKGVALLEEGHDIHHIGWRYVSLGKILCSRSDTDSAKALVPKMEALLETRSIPPWIASSIEALMARIWFMDNNTKRLDSWIERKMIAPDGGQKRYYESEYIELAHILIHLGRCDEAQKIISPLLIKQEKEGRSLPLLETLMVQTQIFKNENRIDDAIETLAKAFSVAAPGGYLRIFMDEEQLVFELLDKFTDAQRESHRNFIMKLNTELVKGKTVNYSNALVEQLSAREMDVLQMISAGLSNKKTAESLFISVNTLKTHLKNIYGKLGVHNRTEAVFKAKEIKLID